MARIRPLAPNEVEAPELALFEDFFAQRGNVPHMYRILARRPEVMHTAKALMDAVIKTGTVDLRLKEMVIVRTSQVNGCFY